MASPVLAHEAMSGELLALIASQLRDDPTGGLGDGGVKARSRKREVRETDYCIRIAPGTDPGPSPLDLAADPNPEPWREAAELEAIEARAASRVDAWSEGTRKSRPEYPTNAPPSPRLILGMGLAWPVAWPSAEDAPCPACAGRRLPLIAYCTICHNAGADPFLVPPSRLEVVREKYRIPRDDHDGGTVRAQAATRPDPLLMDRSHHPAGFDMREAHRDAGRRGR